MLTLQSTSLVLIGKFNPYIISPEWLRINDIWSAVDTRLSLGAAGGDGVQFRGGKIEWRITHNRFSLSSIEKPIGELAAKVMGELPHTPMESTLSTFSFLAESDGFIGPVFEAIGNVCPGNDLTPELSRWGAVFHEDETRVDLMFVSGDEGTTISVLRHRPTRTAQDAILAASEYSIDLRKSEQLVNHFIQGNDS